MTDKIIRLPNSNWISRKRNQVGQGFVPCEVSGRYFKVKNVDDSNYVSVDVMTTETIDNNDKKLTELIIRKDDLLNALKDTNIL